MTAIATAMPRMRAVPRSSVCDVHLDARARRARLLARALRRAVHALRALIMRAYRDHRQRAEARAMHDALGALDDRTLHDLGLERSEIMSVTAEALGASDRTRAQALWHGLP